MGILAMLLGGYVKPGDPFGDEELKLVGKFLHHDRDTIVLSPDPTGHFLRSVLVHSGLAEQVLDGRFDQLRLTDRGKQLRAQLMELPHCAICWQEYVGDERGLSWGSETAHGLCITDRIGITGNS